MVRIKRGNVARKRRKTVLKLAKGYKGAHSRLFRVSNQQVMKARRYSYVSRKLFKRVQRRNWISCINSQIRRHGTTYSQVCSKFKQNKIDPNYMDYFERYYTPAFTYKALNRLIQGSAADMTKKAMVDLYEQGIIPHIQIHDELCFSTTDHESEKIKKIMEETIPLEVKNKVDYESGPNWGAIK